MSTESKTLGAEQLRAIACLLSESTLERAAERAKVSTKTLARWSQKPAFAAALHKARQQLFDSAMEAIKESSLEAITTLRNELKGEKAGDRIRAAMGILSYAFQVRELADHEKRIAELEALLEELGAKYHAEEPAEQDDED